MTIEQGTLNALIEKITWSTKDPKNPDSVEGPKFVNVVVKSETYEARGEERTKYVVAFWNAYSNPPPKEKFQGFKEHYNNGADSFDGYLEWRKKNPRLAPGSARPSASKPPPNRFDDTPPPSDDVIPF